MTDTRILQLTDLHLFCDVDSTLKGIPTRKTLQSVVDAIRKEEGEFDRVVITGDHTHDEQPESYKIARGFFEPWIERLAIVPGNHDDRAVMQSVFGDVIERLATGPVKDDDRIVFSFHCGQWLCLGLDTHAPGEVAGHFGERQADWLRAQLSDHGDNPSLLFCHHPPIDVGSEWMDRIGLKDRHRLLDVVQDYSSVRLICCGHVHHESEGHAGHVRVVTTPSTGIQFDPRGSEPQFANDPPGYRIIELAGDQLKTRVARLPQADHTPTSA
jgi:Icc protein